MEAKELTITYETLFEVLKRERDFSDLQKLDSSFLADFVSYIKEKSRMLHKDDSLFSYEDKKKVEKQVDNAKRIVKELYERREKKVIESALITSRTKSDIIDTSNFLDHELKLFEELTSVLDRHRELVISKVLAGEFEASSSNQDGEQNSISPQAAQPAPSDETMVRFTQPVSKFVGRELEQYGPYNTDDIAQLPTDLAKILVQDGKAEEIQS